MSGWTMPIRGTGVGVGSKLGPADAVGEGERPALELGLAAADPEADADAEPGAAGEPDAAGEADADGEAAAAEPLADGVPLAAGGTGGIDGSQIVVQS
jgi:hypothetical protein